MDPQASRRGVEKGQRIIELQDELEGRTTWALKLQDELKDDLEKRDEHLRKLQEEFEERTEWALQLRDEVEEKDRRFRESRVDNPIADTQAFPVDLALDRPFEDKPLAHDAGLDTAAPYRYSSGSSGFRVVRIPRIRYAPRHVAGRGVAYSSMSAVVNTVLIARFPDVAQPARVQEPAVE